MRNLELAGRSPVHAMQGMAATSHPLATLAAINVLQDGGNAMDAAITACAVQCVVEPQSTGIGGDCFCLYAPAGRGEIVAFNGSGPAPAAATAARLRELGVEVIPRQSPHAVTVPGAIDAWSQLLADHGTRDLAAALGPAIRYAREGYPIPSRCHTDWVKAAEVLAADPTSARIFLPGGAARIHLKDFTNIVAEAEACGLELPFSRTALELFRSLVERGGGGYDHSALLLELEHRNAPARLGDAPDQLPE